MSLSIRNQLPGTVTAVTPGEVMATVRIRLTGGQDLTAAITREAAEDLRLSPGTAVRALMKSTEVSLATAVARPQRLLVCTRRGPVDPQPAPRYGHGPGRRRRDGIRPRHGGGR